jgi:HTH-type transcriptional regulator / antitoxin HigA
MMGEKTKDDEDAQISSPADAIRSALEENGWSQSDLAYVLGAQTAAINQILSGKRGISPEMAKALAIALNKPPEIFAQIQAAWDLRNAREPDSRVKDRAQIQAKYPLREMIKRGWINEECSNDQLHAQLRAFFGVDSLDQVPRLTFAAKRSDAGEVPPSQLAWLFRVRQIASEMPTPAYSNARLSDAVERMRSLLTASEEIRHVPRMLHDAGVRFVIVEGLPGGKIDGVCFWLDRNTPVIGMSLRFDRIDNFWFVLRHECSHVLHAHGKDAAIIDTDLERPIENANEEERIANSDAAEFCVPQEKLTSFYLRKNPLFMERDIIAFSTIVRVHPGIVIGQLQKLTKRYDLLRRHLVSVRKYLMGSAMMDGWGDVVPVSS